MREASEVTTIQASDVGHGRLESPDRMQLSDLGATVYRGHVPDGLADELPALYGSLYSTVDWFLTQGGRPPNGVCVLHEPRHVLLLDRHDGTVNVLNRRFACAPEDADRICRALFRAFPGTHRIHLDVMFPPGRLAFPHRVVERLTHMVIDLPPTVAEYDVALARSTRQHLRKYAKRARLAFPDLQTVTITPGERSRALVDQIVEWKIQRFRGQDRITYWETNASLAEHTAALLRRCGQCTVTSIDGKEAVIHICFRVGDTVFPLEKAHDPAYEAYHLGEVATYELVCSAIESGARHVDLFEGTVESKRRFGARPVLSTRLAVFPSQLSRLHSLDESLKVLRRRSQCAYYALGHRVERYPGGEALARFAKRRRLKKWSESGRTS